MHLLQFFHTLNRAKTKTLDGEPVTRFAFEDDGDESPALRVVTPIHNLLVLPTDRIAVDRADNKGNATVVVSIGAKDFAFVFTG
jgi:hypothetical protein